MLIDTSFAVLHQSIVILVYEDQFIESLNIDKYVINQIDDYYFK